MNPLPLVVAEFRRNRAGSIAVILLIAAALALGVALSAQERALREATARAADRFDLVIGAAGSETQLVLTTVYLQPAALDLIPANALARLQADPGVLMIAPVAVTDSHAGYPVVGTTADFATDGGRVGVLEGRRFIASDEAIVGSAVTIAVGSRIRPAHGAASENVLEAHEHDTQLNIVGRLAATGTPWDRAIIVPIEAVWAMHDAGRFSTPQGSGNAALGPPWYPARDGPVPAIVVKPRTVGDAYRLRQSFRGNGSMALFPAEVLLPLYALLGDVSRVVTALSLALDVLLIGTVLLVIFAVLAGRRAAIGALRALGAPPAFVFLSIWLYAAVLVGAGVVLGLAGGALLAQSLGSLLGSRISVDISAMPGPREAMLALAVLVAGSLLAALPSMATFRVPVRQLLQGK